MANPQGSSAQTECSAKAARARFMQISGQKGLADSLLNELRQQCRVCDRVRYADGLRATASGRGVHAGLRHLRPADSIERSNAKASACSRQRGRREPPLFDRGPFAPMRTTILAMSNPARTGHLAQFRRGQFLHPGCGSCDCGRHGSVFEIDTGCAYDGPCKDKKLERLRLPWSTATSAFVGVELEESGNSGPADDGDAPWKS